MSDETRIAIAARLYLADHERGGDRGSFKNQSVTLRDRYLVMAAAAEDQVHWMQANPPLPSRGAATACSRRQCRGHVPHSWITHWFGWVRR